MGSIEGRQPPEVPSKRERLGKVFGILEHKAPAGNASDAHDMINQAFKAVEGTYAAHPSAKFPMSAGSFTQMLNLSHNGKTVLYEVFKRHQLFIGENGAIEVRAMEKEAETSPDGEPHPFAGYPVEFQKAGADGRSVWGDRISGFGL